ncbi:serum/glucocorticoid-regulated kinase 3, partial [Mytilus galloprovincialis]
YQSTINCKDDHCPLLAACIFESATAYHLKVKKLKSQQVICLTKYQTFYGKNTKNSFLNFHAEGWGHLVQKFNFLRWVVVYQITWRCRISNESSSTLCYISYFDLKKCRADKKVSIINFPLNEKNFIVKPSDFEFLKVIGKGSFGKVLLARHKNESKMFAIKVLQKQAIMKRNEVKHIMSERNVLLKNIKHPFLVGLHYSFQTQDKLYFVLDYVNGGELFFHLQRERYFPEQRAKFYAAEMASAIGYLHSLNIIYRDLKPENILLDSKGHVTLTDFGLCKEGIEGMGTTSTFCGTPEYLAPEVLRKQPYDKTVDWWCLGAVLYEMMYGLPPFYSRDTAEMYDNILYKPLRLRTNVSSAARSILEGLLQKEKEQRLGAKKDFHEIKTHSFFSDINWDDLDKKKIHPPYNPNVSGQLDLKHFDPEFVREPVPASVGKSAGEVKW